MRFPRFRIVALGFACSVTPMVLFLAGVVNPSAIEIAAAILLWIGGYTLVKEAPHWIDSRVVVRVSIAGSVLTVTRQLGPFWLAIIAVTLLAIGGRAVASTLWSARPVRIGVVAMVVCSVAQMAWMATTGTLDASNSNIPGVPGTASQLATGSLGRGLVYYHELIGVFGWRDTNPPTAVWLFWTAALVAIVTLAVLVASRPVLLAILSTAFLTWLIPIVLEARSAGAAGYFWQGRYTLPLAVGVPILAAFAAADRSWSPTVVGRLTGIVGVAFGMSQLLAFVRAIHRYAVGTLHNFDIFGRTPWEPPLPAILLTVMFAGAVVAWYVLLLAAAPADRYEPADSPAEHELLVPSGSTARG